MRLKKQKRHRRAVRFFTTCFGFRQPFKVLCDGTFVHHLHANRISPPDALANILGGTVKLFTTSCVIAELKRLSDEERKKKKQNEGENSYSVTYNLAKKFTIARCDHEKAIQAPECITKIIGEKNSDHFFFATQDTELRENFQEIPGVPLIFGLRNALLMEPPSSFQRQFVRTSEEHRSHMTDQEFKLLKKRVKGGLSTEEGAEHESGGTSDSNEDSDSQALERTKYPRRSGMEKDRPQFKRNRAKGPNPLSCKKKKKKGQSNSSSAKEDNTGQTLRCRPRKRKRSRGSKNITVADGDD